ncbi:GA-binding protein subunit beta-2-like [Toxotes jaculatrix]|uniref:GA-binding protein subunit beta-2-like n=1 Tax=Toxotes jaculatrix TaxID=941984 RepID=UPI001B3ABE1C|nr:GA-binding protein subunit beta-2-like [Toxotes jaculatrix]
MTALHWAPQHGHREVAELLLRHSSDVHCLNKFNKTPFDIVMDTSNTELMDGMQNQVNLNPESHYIIPAGGLVHPLKTHHQNQDCCRQIRGRHGCRVVGVGGQRVITIVTDQHGNQQPWASSSSSPCRGSRVSGQHAGAQCCGIMITLT